jgi:ribonuclease R
VSAATSFGIFVTLDAMYVEGLVHITELGGEYFKFDEARQELRGERTGIRYSIGTRVRVQVSRVDLDGRKIDFRLVREGEELLGRALRDKGGGADGAGGGNSRKSPSRSGGRKSDKAAAVPSPTEQAGLTRERAARSPIQSLKASVKKAAASKSSKGKARKPRRG